MKRTRAASADERSQQMRLKSQGAPYAHSAGVLYPPGSTVYVAKFEVPGPRGGSKMHHCGAGSSGTSPLSSRLDHPKFQTLADLPVGARFLGRLTAKVISYDAEEKTFDLSIIKKVDGADLTAGPARWLHVPEQVVLQANP
uniref:Uncharacterized protein n=1 Tax=Haptolina ericina TaxID=156174 RepID=A0A7S3B0Z8_9EUKA|mmetsp:Transcript_42626/g.96377  ORF Transcript_42626/g.96377 Transcript_42626/m.96377 type:complete len:141 (+) Transcript_42626:70-492(+)